MVLALGDRRTREAARAALEGLGAPAVAPLANALLDCRTSALIRRVVPGVLARLPSQQTIDVMLRLVLAPETDQLLDHRTIRALSKVRARNPDLVFDRDLVARVADESSDAAARYAAVRPALRAIADTGRAPIAHLLLRALDDAWAERREDVFRCLGMLHPPERVHSAYDALARGTSSERANAREWLETTIGLPRFRRLAAVLEPAPGTGVPAAPTLLVDDADPWVALLARALTHPVETDMELIEKVFLLQQVDLLQDARGAHVALLASIAEVVDVPADAIVLRPGAVPDAMYVVTRGAIQLDGAGHHIVAGPEQAFGTWALIDDHPGRVEARALEPSRLLRVTREDFQDLLADHPELALGLLRGLARRMRQMVA
jgi:hypothetical protein